MKLIAPISLFIFAGCSGNVELPRNGPVPCTPGAVIITAESNGANCSFGGVSLKSGNCDAQYVCNGAPGAVGPQGDVGPIGLQGEQGPIGPQGPQGIAGLMGPVGPTGIIGPVGPIGSTGPQGPQGVQGLKGDTGAKGATGVQGTQGIAGPAGATGPIGPQGPQGIAGLTGSIGPTGATGAVGPMGPAGVSGTPGPAGPTLPLSMMDAITPCSPNSSPWKELIFCLADGNLLGSFSANMSGLETRLAFVGPGSYEDTDSSGCNFNVVSDGNGGNIISWSAGHNSYSTWTASSFDCTASVTQ